MTAPNVRTVGVEEELLLLDPVTREAAARAPQVLRAHRGGAPATAAGGAEDGPASSDLSAELFQHQVETRTDPATDLDDLHAQLVAARRGAGTAARAAGVAAVACAIVPFGPLDPRLTDDDRYRAMLEQFGDIARSGGTCGMHVHVGIDSPEEGVAVIDRIAPWLPVLLAVSANSPYAGGRDTGYASWRSQVWSRWPSAGTTEAFGSVEGYERACRDLLATGAARDDGMLYFDARLSRDHPTVEVRVLDVCTDPEDAVLLAGLVRALVTRAAEEVREGTPCVRPRAELLRAAGWRAARYGLAERLVDPGGAELRPAAEVLHGLVDTVRPWLEAAGDLDRVQEGLRRVLRAGGATRQRAAYERSVVEACAGGGSAGGPGSAEVVAAGVRGVVDDLVARSEEVWAPLSCGNR